MNIKLVRMRRLERARNLDSGLPVFPDVHDTSALPWWTTVTVDPAWGEVVGVQAPRGERSGSFAICERGLLLAPGSVQSRWMSYEEIDGWDPPAKVWVDQAVDLRLRDGSTAKLAFPRGGAFTFVRILNGVVSRTR